MLVSAFLLPLQTQLVFALFFTCGIFFGGIFLLFALHLEFIPAIILMVVVGAILILIIFAVFISNQQSNRVNPLLTNKFYFYTYFILSLKGLLFFSTLKFTSFTQIWFINFCGELPAFKSLYNFSDSTNYSAMVLIIAFLLLIVTIGVSVAFSNPKNLKRDGRRI